MFSKTWIAISTIARVVAAWVQSISHDVAELGCLVAIVAGVDMLAGPGWAYVAAGLAGLAYLELDELLVLMASLRRKK